MLSDPPTLMISLSSGWAVRNFFHTGVLDRLRKDFHVVGVATPSIREALRAQGYADKITLVGVDRPVEPPTWTLIRQLKKKVWLEARRSQTEEIWERYYPRPLYKRLGGGIVRGALRVLDGPTALRVLETLDARLAPPSTFSEVFAAHRPGLFFATHASTFFENALLKTARAFGVPSVYMVLSWDHLSSKVVLSPHYTRVLVWNSLVKAEVLRTPAEYIESQIGVVGIPQFDVYGDPPAQSYPDWCRQYGLDPTRRTILYCSAPRERHDQQGEIVEGLLQAIGEGKGVPSDAQVLIKCHPFDPSSDYEHLLGRYPLGIHRSSLAPGQPQEHWVPDRREWLAMRDALHHCSVNINVFSTVTLEAALLDKPIIHIAFDPRPVHNRIPCAEYYRFDHFAPITRSGAGRLVRSFDELYLAVGDYMRDPARDAAARRRLVDSFFDVPLGTATGRVSDELIRMGRGSAAALPA